MKSVLLESFQWAEQIWPIMKEFENDGTCYYRVIASNADIKNRNGRVYTSEELSRAAASLSERPLNVNHNPKETLHFPENQVLIARFEEGRVECIIQVEDPKIKNLIDSGEINTVSIEGFYLDTSKNKQDTEYPTSLHFRALALLTRDNVAGDPLAQILKEASDKGSRSAVFVPGLISEQIISKESEYSTANINDLPDDAFAYIEPGGAKDEEGKTTPRSLRHLPFKNASGKVDPAHVRNALARLPQTNIPAQAKAAAHRKLAAAAKQVGIEVSTDEAGIQGPPPTQSNTEPSIGKMSGPSSDSDDADSDPVVNPNEDHSRNPRRSEQENIPSMMPNLNSVGVGNPQAQVKPQMDYPESKNPLSITNQPAPKLHENGSSIPVTPTEAPDLMTALKNATDNTHVAPSRPALLLQDSAGSVTNHSQSDQISLSQTEQVVTKPSEQSTPVKESAPSTAPISVSVKLEGVEEFKQTIHTFGQSLKELTPLPKPNSKISGTEQTVGTPVEDHAVKETARFQRIAAFMRSMINVQEDIATSGASGALGQIWSPTMIVLPPDLPANLRRFVQVKEIPKGSKQVNFTTITTPAFASLTEDTAPSDVSQTISEISVTPSETGCKQRVSYQVMESATPDVVQAVERAFQAAALIDEDSTILTALDGATPADTLYGDESVSGESSITSSMTFAAKRLASALREIQKKGYSIGPGDLVACLHPVQYDALLKDTAISQYLYFGSVGPIQQAVIPQVYGVDVVRSTKVPTGTGAGSPAITTYHAQVFLKASAKGDPNGLGVGGTAALGISRDLMIETWRKIDERALYIVASHRVACGILQPNALVHVYTA
ncbi:MAG TPA: hypothetical protein VFF30_18315 [Nitrososphaerales archaeon]|nr:hypothetical protein [Nitrososphaerales archaeon]